jgi:hypothetical protein
MAVELSTTPDAVPRRTAGAPELARKTASGSLPAIAYRRPPEVARTSRDSAAHRRRHGRRGRAPPPPGSQAREDIRPASGSATSPRTPARHASRPPRPGSPRVTASPRVPASPRAPASPRTRPRRDARVAARPHAARRGAASGICPAAPTLDRARPRRARPGRARSAPAPAELVGLGHTRAVALELARSAATARSRRAEGRCGLAASFLHPVPDFPGARPVHTHSSVVPTRHVAVHRSVDNAEFPQRAGTSLLRTVCHESGLRPSDPCGPFRSHAHPRSTRRSPRMPAQPATGRTAAPAPPPGAATREPVRLARHAARTVPARGPRGARGAGAAGAAQLATAPRSR